jgi:hypothetical protein
VSLVLHGEAGLSPYKIKLMAFPQLIQQGFIRAPWDHMTEAMEKSNHHAHKDFQTRTMRGGGGDRNEDPTYLDLHHNFCRLLKISCQISEKLIEIMNHVHVTLNGEPLPPTKDIPSYLKVCRKKVIFPVLRTGVHSPLPLMGMRFLTLGRFAGAGMPTAAVLADRIRDLGGIVLDKAMAVRIFRSHAKTPHCYIILKDGKDLAAGTTKTSQKKVPSKTALDCHVFAGGDFTFLRWGYIPAVEASNCTEDLAPFILTPGSFVKPNIVKEMRQLMIRQCKEPGTDTIPAVSTITSVKMSRRPPKC